MTLILTHVGMGGVLQVADRLVSQSTAEETRVFDARSNKNVIFLARNGLATIAYTGVSFLGKGRHTDQWIVECLTGFEIAKGHRGDAPALYSMGNWSRNWPDMGQAVDRLQRRLAEAVANLEPQAWRHHAPTVVIAGWMNQGHKRVRPFGCSIYRHPTLGYTRRWVGRHLGRRALTGQHPMGHIPVHEYRALQESLGTMRSLEELKDAFVKQIRIVAARQAASQRQVVGSDCMCIALHRPTEKLRVDVDYRPSLPERAWFDTAQGRIELPVSFTPWLVTNGVIAAPRISSGGGGGIETVGPLELHYSGSPEGDRLPSHGLLIVEQAQKRRPRPV